jgi:hypothetical protein
VEASRLLGKTSVIEADGCRVGRNSVALPKQSARESADKFIADSKAKAKGDRSVSMVDLRYRCHDFASAFN